MIIVTINWNRKLIGKLGPHRRRQPQQQQQQQQTAPRARSNNKRGGKQFIEKRILAGNPKRLNEALTDGFDDRWHCRPASSYSPRRQMALRSGGRPDSTKLIRKKTQQKKTTTTSRQTDKEIKSGTNLLKIRLIFLKDSVENDH